VGWLNVVASTDPVPSPSDVSTAVATQVAADVAAGYTAESLADHQAPHHNADGTMTWNMSAGTASPDGHTVILEMLPRNVHIRKGDSVKWVSSSPNEPHTVTFPTDQFTDFMPSFEAEGRTPPGEIVLAPGNGVSTVTTPLDVSDSGLLASQAEGDAFGLPSDAYLLAWQVSFAGAQAGTYTYVCQIHPGMQGTVTVIPAH
jgi:plastocyanin